MMPCWVRLTVETSTTCGPMSPARNPRSMTTIPPSSASTAAIADRVTVSMLADTIGRLSAMCSEKRVLRSITAGSRLGTTPSCGVNRKSSKVRPRTKSSRFTDNESTTRTVLGSWFRVLGSRFQVLGSRFWVPRSQILGSACRNQEPVNEEPGTQNREPGTQNQEPQNRPWYISRMTDLAVLTTVSNQPGVLFGLTKVLADRQANITYVDIIHHPDRDPEIYLEFSADGDLERLTAELRQVGGVSNVEVTPSFSKIYGKRIIIMGGGAQVGQVALGAVAEADRHNIRGERISVDTIPLEIGRASCREREGG